MQKVNINHEEACTDQATDQKPHLKPSTLHLNMLNTTTLQTSGPRNYKLGVPKCVQQT